LGKIVLFVSILFSSVFAEESIKIGIKPSEPWVMFDKNSTENPRGFSIDLWNKISEELQLETQFVYYNNTKEIVEATKSGEIDAGITAITMTASREKEIDFSHSMYELGLQIMVSADEVDSNPLNVFLKEAQKLFSITGFLYFLLFLFITINLRWFADRRLVSEKAFADNYIVGIYDAFWWALTMLITWETPRSKGLARIIDLTWHVIGLVGLSILTAVVTASLTAKTISGSIKSEKDLIGKYVATVENDAPHEYLEHLGARVVPVKTLDEGIELVKSGKVKALVYDGPRLVYLKNEINKIAQKKVLEVLPLTFNHQNYGITFPTNSNLIEPVNRTLLKLREADGIEKSFHDKLKEKWMSQN
jgi:polar amino acid transport system substrate-binding protein